MSPVILRQPPENMPKYGLITNNIAWVLLVCSFLFVLTRIGTKYAVSNKFGVDDVLIIVSLIFAIIRTVLMNLGVANGLGDSFDALTHHQIDVIQKYIYASAFLFILSQTFSKISVLVLIRQLSPVDLHQRLGIGLGSLMSAWSLTSLFVLAFQCHLPQTWDIIFNECIDLRAAWNYINVANIILELGVVALPLLVILKVKITLKRKIIVIGSFWSRILLIAAIIWQAVRFNASTTSFGSTFLDWLSMVTVTLVENLSIATACVPYLKPFLESLESGMIRSDDLRRRGQSTTDYAYGSGIRKRVDVSVAFKSNDSKNTDVELSQISTLRTMASVTSGDHNRRSSDRRDSQGSRAQMLPQSKAWVGENISPYATENLSQQNNM